MNELECGMITELLYRVAVVNCAVNPVIYAIWYKHFREGVKIMFKDLTELFKWK